ncbi:TetR/AcrR family transcriptional regulator [Microbacterium aureliae]
MPSTSSRRPAAERRAEIAAAAQALALESGLSAVTLRAIAQRMGVAPALVAHYVASMDEVVADAFTRIVDAELGELERLAGAQPEPGRALDVVLASLIDAARDDVTLVWVQSWALGGRNEVLAAAVREAMDRWRAFLAGILRGGRAEGAFRIADPDAVAAQILGMIDGVNAHSLVSWQDPAERLALLRRSVEALIGAAGSG